METKLILEKSIGIDASTKEVWKAITDPGLIKQYFYGTEVLSNWQEGGAIIFTGIWEGQTYEDKGRILQVVPEKLFKYNYWSNMSGTEDVPENYTDITYKLQQLGSATTFKVIQEGFKDQESMEHSDKSWDHVLLEMKKLLESGNQKR